MNDNLIIDAKFLRWLKEIARKGNKEFYRYITYDRFKPKKKAGK